MMMLMLAGRAFGIPTNKSQKKWSLGENDAKSTFVFKFRVNGS